MLRELKIGFRFIESLNYVKIIQNNTCTIIPFCFSIRISSGLN